MPDQSGARQIDPPDERRTERLPAGDDPRAPAPEMFEQQFRPLEDVVVPAVHRVAAHADRHHAVRGERLRQVRQPLRVRRGRETRPVALVVLRLRTLVVPAPARPAVAVVAVQEQDQRIGAARQIERMTDHAVERRVERDRRYALPAQVVARGGDGQRPHRGGNAAVQRSGEGDDAVPGDGARQRAGGV
jgi:hypothetical protein